MGDEKPEAGKRAFRLGSTERKTGGVFESLQGRIEGIRKSTGDNACAQEILCRTREKLTENHISFLPFYEAVDFTEYASIQDRDLLECQLEDAGLLDALVVVQKDYTRAMKVLGAWSDKILCLEDSGKMRCRKLTAATEDMELRKMTERILSNIGEEDDCRIVLRPDGYFRHGALEGYSRPETEACYIGESIRREKKKEQIRKKRKNCSFCSRNWKHRSRKSAE